MADVDAKMAELRAIGAEMVDLARVIELVGWDQETMMPAQGVPYRARQSATLHGLLHECLTQPRVGELLAALAEPAASGQLALADAATVRELRREYERAVKVPTELVKAMAQATSEGVEIWRRAREEARFGDFAPALERLLDLKRQVAEHVGYTGHIYNALLDEYEPGLTVEQLSPLFAELREGTVALLAQLRTAPRQPDRLVLEREYDVEKQWAFGQQLVRWIGFDLAAGRIDRSTHPFAASMGPGDVRLTSRVSPNDLAMAMFGNLHEAGHGLYEQGLDPELAQTFVGQYASLGIHESQSRLWENMVGRGRPFWQFAYPQLQAVFPEQLGGVDLDRFMQAINQVTPSLIRVEADEVTYNLHIILRYELELRLVTGELPVRDLPGAWNEKMEQFLGLTPPDDALGVLQDTHWAVGYLGYFPTYTLGNLYAAQLWDAVRRDIPSLDEQLARGECGALLRWLRERIHQHGKIYTPAELIERATGAPPRPEYLLRYLRDKFQQVYGIAPAAST